jgi:endoglucanase
MGVRSPGPARRGFALAVAGSLLVTLAGGCLADDRPTATSTGAPARPSSGPPSARSGIGAAPTPKPAGPAASPSRGGNPLAGRRFYVDPDRQAARQAEQWRSAGRSADAGLIDRIATRPVAHWLVGGDPGATRSEVAGVTSRAARAGRLPVLVVYNIPHRDCGQFSGGGAAGAEAYRGWIRAVAAGIGSRAAVVVVEPDALGHALDRCGPDPAQTYTLLGYAARTLKAANRDVHVYLDAGNPGWEPDPRRLASALRSSGIADADGFALNVANFHRTTDNVRYGTRLSDALGGVHFVIDTSRNGTGPWPGGGTADGAPSWCNPPGRGLGRAPTSAPGLPRVDALLWVKGPGESDGTCRPGAPPAGQWWPEYALELARNAAGG